MDTKPQSTYSENQLSKIILDAAFRVHTKLGPGLLETVYEVILAHELRKESLLVHRQMAIPIKYEELLFDEGSCRSSGRGQSYCGVKIGRKTGASA